MNSEFKKAVMQCFMFAHSQASNFKLPMQSHSIPVTGHEQGRDILLFDYNSDLIEIIQLDDTKYSWKNILLSHHCITDALVSDI